MSNIQLEEMQDEYFNKQLASYIGISFEDLCELEWDIDTNESNNGKKRVGPSQVIVNNNKNVKKPPLFSLNHPFLTSKRGD